MLAESSEGDEFPLRLWCLGDAALDVRDHAHRACAGDCDSTLGGDHAFVGILALNPKAVLVVILLEGIAEDLADDSAGMQIVGFGIPHRILVHQGVRHVFDRTPRSQNGRDIDAEPRLASGDVVLRLLESHLIDGLEDSVPADLEPLIGLPLHVLGEQSHEERIVIGIRQIPRRGIRRRRQDVARILGDLRLDAVGESELLAVQSPDMLFAPHQGAFLILRVISRGVALVFRDLGAGVEFHGLGGAGNRPRVAPNLRVVQARRTLLSHGDGHSGRFLVRIADILHVMCAGDRNDRGPGESAHDSQRIAVGRRNEENLAGLLDQQNRAGHVE